MSPQRAAARGWGWIAGVGDPQLWWKGAVVCSFKHVFIRLIEHYISLDDLYVDRNPGIKGPFWQHLGWTGVAVTVPNSPLAFHSCIFCSCVRRTCACSFSVSMLQPCGLGLVLSKVMSRHIWILEVTLKGSTLAKRLRNKRSSSLQGKENTWKANLWKPRKLLVYSWYSCSLVKGLALMIIWHSWQL